MLIKGQCYRKLSHINFIFESTYLYLFRILTFQEFSDLAMEMIPLGTEDISQLVLHIVGQT